MDESKDHPYLRPPVFIVGTHADEPIEDVQGLVEAFREGAVTEHLLDILTNVNHRVSEMVATLRALDDNTKMKDFKQVSHFESTLRKKKSLLSVSHLWLCYAFLKELQVP